MLLVQKEDRAAHQVAYSHEVPGIGEDWVGNGEEGVIEVGRYESLDLPIRRRVRTSPYIHFSLGSSDSRRKRTSHGNDSSQTDHRYADKT
jgi:hypothetical protein